MVIPQDRRNPEINAIDHWKSADIEIHTGRYVKGPQHGLFAPAGFWDLTQRELERIANGCGPGAIGDFLVPDVVLGLNITPACNIHDYCYSVASVLREKWDYDDLFLWNMWKLADMYSRNIFIRKCRKFVLRGYWYQVYTTNFL